MANPTLLTQPFAANGDKNVIPNTTAVQGAFSQDKGFPAECSLPLGAGGVAPSRQDFNGAFNMLSSLMYYTQKGYTWHWDAGQEYFVGCVVIDDTDGNMYQCIQDVAAGGNAPSTEATNWKLDTVDVSDRAKTDLSNLTQEANDKLKAMAFPSATKINITGLSSNTEYNYTAPANGFISLVAVNASTCVSTIHFNGTTIAQTIGNSAYSAALVIPIKKGNTYGLTYTSSTGYRAEFYFAEGEV